MRVGALLMLSLALSAETRPQLLQRMDAEAPHWSAVSRRIWEFAEVGYQERQSSAALRAELESAGFRIHSGIGGMPTAFTAEWGQGTPAIGIMGEFDALPGLSQDAVAERKPRAAGAPGHGCGHNLLGAAAAHAAIAVKRHLEANRLKGTIRFLATPAEEGGGGKIYLLRAGAFDNLDAVLTWHPGDANRANLESTLANITAKFRFRGRAAHAAMNPEAGRSALDGLLLMTHAVEMLREHVPQETRLHYTITRGGSAPNIVPDFAELYLYARHPRMTALDAIWSRILKTAQGTSLATETEVETELVSSVWDVLPNDTLARVLHKNLSAVGGVSYTPAEQSFAEKLRQSEGMSQHLPLGSQFRVLDDSTGLGASTDVGDVSWNLPTAQFTTATLVPGTPGHSWQSTACAGMSIGQKGMLAAAKVLALSALDLIADPKLLAAARADFDKRRAGATYRSRIPADAKPPLDYRK